MLHIARTLMEICLFRAGPQDLPASTHLLGLSMVVSMTLSFLGARELRPSDTLVLEMLAVTGFTAAFTYSLLVAYGLPARFIQTGSAVFGSHVVLAVPVYLLSLPIARQGPEEAPAAMMALLALVIWHVGILGHIFRNALNQSLGAGVLVAIVYYILSSWLSSLVAG